MAVNQALLRIENKFAFLDATGTCHRAVAQAFHRQGHTATYLMGFAALYASYALRAISLGQDQ